MPYLSLRFILLFIFPILIILDVLLYTNARAELLPPPMIPVRAYVLMDYQSGKILANIKGDERTEPASITKLMAGYVIYKALKSDKIHTNDKVTITEKAWKTPGSKMFVRVNTQVSVEELLMGMVVQSGNDATVALAEYVAGSEENFTKLMNYEAERLGLRDSHFTNATGLPDPNHYMSAHDIATLARALIRDFPEQYSLYSVRSFRYNNIEQPNRNRLLFTDPSVDGIKTGHTESAGYCLVSSSRRDNNRLVSVVLGASKDKERFSASQTLLNYGFSFFESRKLQDADIPIVVSRIWKGRESQLPLGLESPLYITVPKDQAPQVNTISAVEKKIVAPVYKNQKCGELIVKFDDQEVNRVPLVALRTVSESSWFGRLMDSILMFFYYIFN